MRHSFHFAFAFSVPNASPIHPRVEVCVQHATWQDCIGEVEAQPQLEPTEAILLRWIAIPWGQLFEKGKHDPCSI